MKEINVTQFVELLKTGHTPFLLDVREDDEVQNAPMRGLQQYAIHIPVSDVVDRHSEIPMDKEVIIYCHTGGRSKRVAQYLAGLGYTNVTNLDGGYVAWQAATTKNDSE